MRDDVREFERLYRIGGEEFAALLTGAEIADARKAAERLRSRIVAAKVETAAGPIDVTVSVGVAATSGSGDPRSLIEAADAALYRAKAGGRNRVVVDEGLVDEVRPTLTPAGSV